MRFTKMHGTGNDFILIDNISEKLPEGIFPELARALCRRRLSIGADGLMVVDAARGAGDFRMIFYNSDGSEGEMCGNGARCVTRYGFERGLASGGTVTVETASGVVTGEARRDGLYTVRLADPSVADLDVAVTARGHEYRCSYVELGSPGLPHAVVLDGGYMDVPEDELREICRDIRHWRGFPKGANVTFCAVTGADSVSARTFERGVEDFTLACGTGVGATVTALTLRGLVSGHDVAVAVPGGALSVTLTVEDGAARDIRLTGPAVVVAEGDVRDPDALALLAHVPR